MEAGDGAQAASADGSKTAGGRESMLAEQEEWLMRRLFRKRSVGGDRGSGSKR